MDGPRKDISQNDQKKEVDDLRATRLGRTLHPLEGSCELVSVGESGDSYTEIESESPTYVVSVVTVARIFSV